ncbi:pseudouridine synthase [candidate division GN15 bacterium]|nr:pseudouridine synthase [candidate division GN15 bacterium]
MSLIRINKYLSQCGVTSRRGAEALITEGRVTINGETVSALGTMVNDESDTVQVDGQTATPVDKRIYIALNKPRMTITTLHDPFKRRTVLHYLKQLGQRVYPVGRLDFDAEGLLLLTNDGDLAYRLAHPRYQVPKVYEAVVNGEFTREAGEKIAAGIQLDDGAVGKAETAVLKHMGEQTRVRLILTEGRKHEVKQLCRKVGFPVKRLRRVEFAGIPLKGLKPGQWRHLTTQEIARLQRAVDLAE